MTEAPETTAGKLTKLNRVERNAWTKRRIFDAATRIVGKYGYAEASVARITEQAGVALGSFQASVRSGTNSFASARAARGTG